MGSQGRVAVAAGTSGLWYSTGSERKPVPAWAEAFVGLGAACAGRPHPAGERLIAAIAVPMRAYCSALAAVGAVDVPESAESTVINGTEALDSALPVARGAASGSCGDRHTRLGSVRGPARGH